MRTITENLFQRLLAQAEEAELQGLTKIAESLTNQIELHSSLVRSDNDFYSYNEEEFRNDLNTQMWSAVIRIADFYGIRGFDASILQDIIEKTADNLVVDLCGGAGINHGVGLHEDMVPGERIEHIEVTEGKV